MELTRNDTAVITNSAKAEAGTPIDGEIDLYHELIAFAELSPEEQLRGVAPPEKMSAEKGTAPESAEKGTASEPLLLSPTIEPMDEKPALEQEAPSAAEAEKPTSPEPVLTITTIAVAQPVTAQEEETLTAAESEQPATPKPVLALLRIEPVPVQQYPTLPAAESAWASEVSMAPSEPIKATPEPFESRPDGPLSGFSLTPDFVFTGALSRGVCLACGAESGADDLFCVSCGVFMDEIASTLPFNPACFECKQGIELGEIFCPWCGSSLPE